NVSVAAMFIGGFMPAAGMGLCLMLLIYFRARRAGTPRLPRAPLDLVVRAGVGAGLPLLLAGMLVAGVFRGGAAPSEGAARALAFGPALAVFAYRAMDLASLLRTVADTAALAGVLLFIFAAASGFSWTLTVAYLPQRLVALLNAVGNSTEIFMLCS